MNNCTEMPDNVGRKLYNNEFKNDAAGTNIKYRSITDRWEQDQMYRASPQAGGKTRLEVVLWDEIVVNEDKSNHPRHNCTIAQKPKERHMETVQRRSMPTAKGDKESRALARITNHQEQSHARGNSLREKTKRRNRRHANVHGREVETVAG